MTHTIKAPIFAALFMLAAAWPAAAQRTDLVDRLIDRIVANEQDFVETMRQYRPVLETYLQEVADDSDADAPILRDHYMVGKLTLDDGVHYDQLFVSEGFDHSPEKRGLPFFWKKKSRRNYFIPEGFAQMVVPDATHFTRRTYEFEYVRREFLGNIRTLVFDVAPHKEGRPGRFVGRIWVEDKQHKIVRFNGTYTSAVDEALFFHFDSWRVNVAGALWMPAFVYVQDANALGPDGETIRFKAQTRLWGYSAFRGSKLQELTEILVEADHEVQDESGSEDVTPLESQRIWTRQAEENVIQRLEKSGLLAPKGEVDDVLNTVVRNLIITNKINLEVECRVLLTTPLETFSIGQSIVISRGLIDVLPDEASLAMVLSDELAHIALGHRTETMFAFSDQTMFEDSEILQKLRLGRGVREVEAASRKAIEMLSKSPYKGKLANAGLFLKVLENRAPYLTNLIQANLGNQLASDGNLLRLSELAGKAPDLDEGKMEQIAALPLGSRLRLDPWTNTLHLVKTKPVALLSARDKMPFEVTPFVIHLTRMESSLKAAKPTHTAERR